MFSAAKKLPFIMNSCCFFTKTLRERCDTGSRRNGAFRYNTVATKMTTFHFFKTFFSCHMHIRRLPNLNKIQFSHKITKKTARFLSEQWQKFRDTDWSLVYNLLFVVTARYVRMTIATLCLFEIWTFCYD